MRDIWGIWVRHGRARTDLGGDRGDEVCGVFKGYNGARAHLEGRLLCGCFCVGCGER